MVIMIYFHWIVQSPMHPERQMKILVKALSLDNVILFMLATPVQVGLVDYLERCFNAPFPDIRRSKLLRPELESAKTRVREHGRSGGTRYVHSLWIFAANNRGGCMSPVGLQSHDVLRCPTDAAGVHFTGQVARVQSEGTQRPW